MIESTELKTKMVFAVGISSEEFQTRETEGVYAFGNKGDLPWGHCKEDLKGFKKETENHVLIMGANTFRSLPKKLPGRIHVVMSSSAIGLKARNGDTADHVIHGGSLSDAICLMKETYHQNVAIIGGKSLIIEALDNELADQIVITHLYAPDGVKYEADVEIDLYPYSRYLLAGSGLKLKQENLFTVTEIENNPMVDSIYIFKATKYNEKS